jgi:hypothetical protein
LLKTRLAHGPGGFEDRDHHRGSLGRFSDTDREKSKGETLYDAEVQLLARYLRVLPNPRVHLFEPIGRRADDPIQEHVNMLAASPKRSFKPPKVTDAEVVPFSEKQVADILAACDKFNGKSGASGGPGGSAVGFWSSNRRCRDDF